MESDSLRNHTSDYEIGRPRESDSLITSIITDRHETTQRPVLINKTYCNFPKLWPSSCPAYVRVTYFYVPYLLSFRFIVASPDSTAENEKEMKKLKDGKDWDLLKNLLTF